MKYLVTFATLCLLIFVPYTAHAAVIAGDKVCGTYTLDAQGKVIIDRCVQEDISYMIDNIFGLVIRVSVYAVGLAILGAAAYVMIAAFKGEDANALRVAKDRATRAVVMLIGFALLASGAYYAFLTYLGVNDAFLEVFRSLISVLPFDHAYATTTDSDLDYLKEPIIGGYGENGWEELLLNGVYLFIRWFVLPIMIGAWVTVGFMFVFAQGNPEMLTKAKKILLITFIGTVMIILANGFLTTVRQTADQITPALQN